MKGGSKRGCLLPRDHIRPGVRGQGPGGGPVGPPAPLDRHVRAQPVLHSTVGPLQVRTRRRAAGKHKGGTAGADLQACLCAQLLWMPRGCPRPHLNTLPTGLFLEAPPRHGAGVWEAWMVLTCGCVWWSPLGHWPHQSPGAGLPEDGENASLFLETAPLSPRTGVGGSFRALIWL